MAKIDLGVENTAGVEDVNPYEQLAQTDVKLVDMDEDDDFEMFKESGDNMMSML